MATFSRTYITAELSDGRFLRDRVILSDQMQLEKTARARGWDNSKEATQANMFLAFCAFRRSGHDVGEWEAFFGGLCVDFSVDNEDVDTETGEPVAGDPTR